MRNQLLGQLIASGCMMACCIAACETTIVVVSNPGGPPQANGDLSQGYAYIADASPNASAGPGAIYQYRIGTNGSLTPLGVASVPAGHSPSSIVADSTGHFVYAANSGDNTLSQFAVGAGGALTPLSPAAISLVGVPSGAGSYSLSVDPADPYLYVVASGSSGSQPQAVIGQFSIGADGTLTPLSPAYLNLPVFAPGALAIDPTGAHAYLGGTASKPGTAGSASEVLQFTIGRDGTLAPLAPASVPAAGTVVRIVFAPSGGTAYALSTCIDSNCDGSITPYTIGNSGGLTAPGAATLTAPNVHPVDLAIDGSGSSAYLIANTFADVGDGNDGGLYPYATNGAGALTAGTPVPLPTDGSVVAENAYGPDLYVLMGTGGIVCCGHTVAIYSIGSQGELTTVSSTQIAEVSAPSGIVLIAMQ